MAVRIVIVFALLCDVIYGAIHTLANIYYTIMVYIISNAP